MKKLIQGFLLTLVLVPEPILACTRDGKEGFVPENSLNIPVDRKELTGISKKQFHKVIDLVEEVYEPIVAEHGGKLKILRNWKEGTVNAYAEQDQDQWIVSMYGGLARHSSITADGFALVLCHELGHHIGGAPKYDGDDWASNEGQADYFANLKCLRRIWLNEDNASIVSSLKVPKVVRRSCHKSWKDSPDRDICIRSAMGGDSVAKLFDALSWSMKPSKFDTPDEHLVPATEDYHASTQCRLDTYFQASLCEIPFTEELVPDSEVPGTCHGTLGHKTGLRPRCWFLPTVN